MFPRHSVRLCVNLKDLKMIALVRYCSFMYLSVFLVIHQVCSHQCPPFRRRQSRRCQTTLRPAAVVKKKKPHTQKPFVHTGFHFFTTQVKKLFLLISTIYYLVQYTVKRNTVPPGTWCYRKHRTKYTTLYYIKYKHLQDSTV